MLIKQHKSTTKPPYAPVPYEVTTVQGNRVTATRGNQIRRRDKNKVKVLKPRPNHLRPSWQHRHNTTTLDTAPYDEFDIEGIDLSNQLHSASHQIVNADVIPEQVATPEVVVDDKTGKQVPDHAPQTILDAEQTIFTITRGEEERMQALLSNATARSISVPTQPDDKATASTSGRTLRSHNVQLEWNRSMSGEPAVTHSTAEQ